MGPGLEPSCPTSHTSQSGDGGQGATELAIPAGTWSLVGRQERAGRKEDQTRTYKHELHWGSGGGGGWEWESVFLQAPKHGSRHALLLQPHLWGRQGEQGHSPGGGPALPLPVTLPGWLAGWPLTIGLQVHLVLVLVLAQLNLLWVGLLRQLGQLLSRGVAPGAGEGVALLSWAQQPPSTSPPEGELAGSQLQGLPSPHKQDLALGP